MSRSQHLSNSFSNNSPSKTKTTFFKPKHRQIAKAILIISILLLEGIGQSITGGIQSPFITNDDSKLDNNAITKKFEALSNIYETLEEKKNQLPSLNNSLGLQSSEDSEGDWEDKRLNTELTILDAKTKWKTNVDLFARLTFEHDDRHDDHDSSHDEHSTFCDESNAKEEDYDDHDQCPIVNETIEFYLHFPIPDEDDDDDESDKDDESKILSEDEDDDDSDDEEKAWTLIGTARTNSTGWATLRFFADLPAQRYFTRAVFSGTTEYKKSKSFVNHHGLIVKPVKSETTINTLSDVNFTDQLPIQAIIRDEFQRPVETGVAYFGIYRGSTVFWETFVPVSGGIAEVNYTVGLSAGFYSLKVLYTGTQNITYSKNIVGITVHPEDTRFVPKGKIAFNPVYSEYGLNETIVLRLTDDEGVGLANQFLNISILDDLNNSKWNIGINTSLNGLVVFEKQLLFLPGNYSLLVEFRNESYFVSRIFERAIIIDKANLMVKTDFLKTQYTDPFEYIGKIANVQNYWFTNVPIYGSLYWVNSTTKGEELIPFEQSRQLTNGTINLIGSKPIFLNGKFMMNITIEESRIWRRKVFLFETFVTPELISITTNSSSYTTTFDKELTVTGRIAEDEGNPPPAMTVNAWYTNASGTFSVGKGFSDPSGEFILTLQPQVLLPNTSLSYSINLNVSTIDGYQQLKPSIIYVFVENVLRLHSNITAMDTTWGQNATVRFRTTDLFGKNQTNVRVVAQYAYRFGNVSQNIILAEAYSINGSVELNLILNRSLFLPGFYPIEFTAYHPGFSEPYSQQLTLEVQKTPTQISIPTSIVAFWGQTITINSTLVEHSPQNLAINNSRLEYYIRPKTSLEWLLLGTSKTNAMGLGQFGYNGTNPQTKQPLLGGIYELLVRFGGNSLYLESNTTGTLKIKEIATSLSLEYLAPRYNDGNVKLKITLKDQFDRPLPDQLITVLFDSTIPVAGYTSAEGVAVIDLSLYLNDVHFEAGNYSLQIRFLGETGKYKQTDQEEFLTILPDLVDLRYSLDVSKDSVVFTLKTDSGQPIPDYPLDFSVQLQTWITLLNATELAYYVPAYAEEFAKNQIQLNQNSFSMTGTGKPTVDYSLGFDPQYRQYLEQRLNISLSPLDENDILQLEPFNLVPSLASTIYDALNQTISPEALFNISSDNLANFVFNLFSDDPDEQRQWIIGELMQDMGTINGLYYITNYNFSSDTWQDLFSNYYYISVGIGSLRFQRAEMFDQKWFDPDTFRSVYDYSDRNSRYRAIDQFLIWMSNELNQKRYTSYYDEPGLNESEKLKKLYDFYFSHRWMIGIIDYFAQYAYAMFTPKSAIMDDLLSLLQSIQSVAREILEISVLSQKANLIQVLQDGIFDNVKEGFKTFLSLGITSQEYSYFTNASGQIEISMKDYVYDQLIAFLEDPNNLLQYPEVGAVVDYLDYVQSNYSISMKDLITRVTSWFNSFGEFAFFFNLNRTGNFAGYVDEKFGYQTFKVSGKIARLYINPYYLNPETDVWDVEQEFFLAVPRDAIQNFAIIIPEMREIWLEDNNAQLLLNGYLEAKRNVGQKISIYQKIGGSYLFLSDVFTGGRSSSTGGGGSDLEFVDVQSSRIPFKGGFFLLDTNPFRGLARILIDDIDSSLQISLSDGLSFESDLVDRGGRTGGGSGGSGGSGGGGGGGSLDPGPIRVDPILTPDSIVLSSKIARLSTASTEYAPIGNSLSNFTYSIDLDNLDIGTHEFMFVYVYKIPKTGNEIIIRKHISVIIKSEVTLEVDTTSNNGQYQINVRATDALGRPVSNLPIAAFIMSSRLDGTTNSLGTVTLFWQPPYPAEFSAIVTSKPTEFYPTSTTKSFTIEDKLVNAFSELLNNTGSTIAKAFEDLTGLSIPNEVAEGLNTLIGKTIEYGSLYLIQPLHLFTGYLDRWYIPGIGNDPTRISRISLEFSRLPLLDVLKQLRLEGLNAFGILEDRYIQITKQNGTKVPWEDIPILNNFVDSEGNIKISVMGIELSAKIPQFSIPIPFLADENGNPAQIIYEDGVIYTSRFENPIYKAITTLKGLRSLTDDGWFDLELPDPLDTLFDNKKDGKISLEINECWTDWFGNEWCIKSSIKVDSPLSIAGPGVIAKISIPDPLELLLPFDFELNGYIDIQIPNPNLFAKAIQAIQPDFQVEYGGGYPSNETFVNIIDLFASPDDSKLNLAIPYLAVRETPLWIIKKGGIMEGVGENEGATMNIPAYIMQLFNVFLDRIAGFVDDIIWGTIYPLLNNTIISSLVDNLNSYRPKVREVISFLQEMFATLPLSEFKQMFDFGISLITPPEIQTSISINGITSALQPLLEKIPFEQIDQLSSFLQPFTDLLNQLGPFKELIKIVAKGVTGILLEIISEIAKEFISRLLENFILPNLTDVFSRMESIVETLMQPFSDVINGLIGNPTDSSIEDDTVSVGTDIAEMILAAGNIFSNPSFELDTSQIRTLSSSLSNAVDTVFQMLMQSGSFDFLEPLLLPFVAIVDGFQNLFGNIIPAARGSSNNFISLSNFNSDQSRGVTTLRVNEMSNDQKTLLQIISLVFPVLNAFFDMVTEFIEVVNDDSEGQNYEILKNMAINDIAGTLRAVYLHFARTVFQLINSGSTFLLSQEQLATWDINSEALAFISPFLDTIKEISYLIQVIYTHEMIYIERDPADVRKNPNTPYRTAAETAVQDTFFSLENNLIIKFLYLNKDGISKLKKTRTDNRIQQETIKKNFKIQLFSMYISLRSALAIALIDAVGDDFQRWLRLALLFDSQFMPEIKFPTNFLEIVSTILMLIFHAPDPTLISQLYPAIVALGEIVLGLWDRMKSIQAASEFVEIILSSITLFKFPAELFFIFSRFLIGISGYYYEFPGAVEKRGRFLTLKHLQKKWTWVRNTTNKLGGIIGNSLKKIVSALMTVLNFILPERLVNRLLLDLPISVQGLYIVLFGRSPPYYYNKNAFWASIKELRGYQYEKMDTQDGKGGIDVLEKYIAGLTTLELFLTSVNQFIVKTIFS